MKACRTSIALILLMGISCIIGDGNRAGALAEREQVRKMLSDWVFPADGIISDHFSSRNGSHKGIDIAGPSGTPVYAAEAGVVIRSYYSDSYGHVLFIRHPNRYETVYAHLSERLAEEGETVSKGKEIGKIGNTGHSHGSHLHFEIHQGPWTVNKENAFDPAFVFAQGQVGKRVTALVPPEQPSIEVSGPSESIIHTVREGDTLWSISMYYGIPVGQLQEQNGLDSSGLIRIGQKLSIKNGL